MATKKKPALSEEQKKEIMERVKKRFTDYLLNGTTADDPEKMIAASQWLYSFIGLTPPPHYIADSPVQAQRIANVLNQEFLGNLQKIAGYSPELSWEERFKLIPRDKVEFHGFCYYGSASDYGWVANYQYFNEIGETDNEGARKMEEYFQAGIFDAIQFEEACILSRMPVRVRVEEERLHSLDGPALEFRDGVKIYFIRGRNVPADLYERCLSVLKTEDAREIESFRKDFINEKNEERRASMFAIVGQVKMCEILGAQEVDSVQVVHRNGEMETISLLKTTEKFRELGNNPLAWVKRICPSTGNIYYTPTRPDFDKALDAAKFHRSGVPGAEQLDYVWDSRS